MPRVLSSCIHRHTITKNQPPPAAKAAASPRKVREDVCHRVARVPVAFTEACQKFVLEIDCPASGSPHSCSLPRFGWVATVFATNSRGRKKCSQDSKTISSDRSYPGQRHKTANARTQCAFCPAKQISAHQTKQNDHPCALRSGTNDTHKVCCLQLKTKKGRKKGATFRTK